PSSLSLPPELLLNGPHDELHHRRVVRHAVQLQATVKVLRDAGRQLCPHLLGLRHLCRLLLRARRTTGTTPMPATAPTVLRLRDHHCRPLLRCFLGNGPWRTTRTTRAPFPSPPPAPTVLRLRPGGDTSEQRLDRGTDLLLHRVSDDPQQAPLPRHRSSLPLARDAIKTPSAGQRKRHPPTKCSTSSSCWPQH